MRRHARVGEIKTNDDIYITASIDDWTTLESSISLNGSSVETWTGTYHHLAKSSLVPQFCSTSRRSFIPTSFSARIFCASMSFHVSDHPIPYFLGPQLLASRQLELIHEIDKRRLARSSDMPTYQLADGAENIFSCASIFVPTPATVLSLRRAATSCL